MKFWQFPRFSAKISFRHSFEKCQLLLGQNEGLFIWKSEWRNYPSEFLNS
ncbi:MAG: hypothetical protein GY795_33250 [Desulfobacterales bacterium]|nr:hypothetical protein [Desulfobacterales bacterium]